MRATATGLEGGLIGLSAGPPTTIYRSVPAVG
jgi:hypothetical protein